MESDEACILIWIYKSEVEDVALHSTTSFLFVIHLHHQKTFGR